jgi:hypothetical protein
VIFALFYIGFAAVGTFHHTVWYTESLGLGAVDGPLSRWSSISFAAALRCSSMIWGARRPPRTTEV